MWSAVLRYDRLFFFVFFFSLRGIVLHELLSFPLQLSEHHAVWFEDLIELSKCFDSPVHVTVRETWRDSANLSKPRSRNSRKARHDSICFFMCGLFTLSVGHTDVSIVEW